MRAIAERRRAERNAWAERYMITSMRGRIYTRPMLRALVLRILRTFKPVLREEWVHAVDRMLDDPAWMRVHHGEIPRSVAFDMVWDVLGGAARRRYELAGTDGVL